MMARWEAAGKEYAVKWLNRLFGQSEHRRAAEPASHLIFKAPGAGKGRRVVDLRSEEEKAIAQEARSPLIWPLSRVKDEIAARRICRLVAVAISHKDEEYREAKYDKIKRIGRQLYANGGQQRMVRVCYRVMALDGTAGAHVRCHWDGIGGWQW
jgi:hypothetical protein